MDNDTTYIGITDWRTTNIKFGIKDRDRLNHIFCLGRSGSGKTTLLGNLAIADIERGKACCVIDPHGDLSKDLLDYVPKERIKDVIYFDATDTTHAIGFNPIWHIEPHMQHLVASSLIATFKQIWDSWGPRLEHTLRYTLLTLLEYGEATLLDIVPLLTDARFRDQVLKKVTTKHLLAFWQNEHDNGAGFKSESVAAIANKVGIFTANKPLRCIFGQNRQTFSLRQVIDENRILIVNLSKGLIGEDSCALLGGILISALQHAALSRASMQESKRRPFFLYVDELHVFTSAAFIPILSEARKYGLSLFMCDQFTEQIPSDILAAIFGNIGTLITFRLSASDAKLISKEFQPVFQESDIIHLSKRSIYLKMMIDGETSKPFSAMTFPLPCKGKSYSEEIIEYSRTHYSILHQEAMKKISTKENKTELASFDQPKLF